MKKFGMVLVVLAGIAFASPSGFAASSVAKACKKELKKYDCKATTEAEASECLEQHEQHGKKNDGFSHACYEAHESFEKKSGKQEAGEERGEKSESAEQKQ